MKMAAQQLEKLENRLYEPEKEIVKALKIYDVAKSRKGTDESALKAAEAIVAYGKDREEFAKLFADEKNYNAKGVYEMSKKLFKWVSSYAANMKAYEEGKLSSLKYYGKKVNIGKMLKNDSKRLDAARELFAPLAQKYLPDAMKERQDDLGMLYQVAAYLGFKMK